MGAGGLGGGFGLPGQGVGLSTGGGLGAGLGTGGIPGAGVATGGGPAGFGPGTDDNTIPQPPLIYYFSDKLRFILKSFQYVYAGLPGGGGGGTGQTGYGPGGYGPGRYGPGVGYGPGRGYAAGPGAGYGTGAGVR